MTQLYSLREAQQQLRLSRSTIRRLVDAQSLQTVAIGRRRLVTASSLETLAKEGCATPSTDQRISND